MNARSRYEVGPTDRKHKWLGPWRVKLDGVVLCYEPTQASAIAYAVLLASRGWKKHATAAEVIIKNKLGRIRDNRTYGFDPKRIKG